MIVRYHFFDPLDHKIHHRAFDGTHQVPDFRYEDRLDWGLIEDFFQLVGKGVEDHDGTGS